MRKDTKRLYIAYGSNLNLAQMAQRCPTAKVVGTAILQNWCLLFCNVATIERHHGSHVPVLVWELLPADEAALDRYEGWPRLYHKENVRITVNGKRVTAMVYVMSGSRQSPPLASYYGTIYEGYVSAGFDTDILLDAAQRAVE